MGYPYLHVSAAGTQTVVSLNGIGELHGVTVNTPDAAHAVTISDTFGTIAVSRPLPWVR